MLFFASFAMFDVFVVVILALRLLYRVCFNCRRLFVLVVCCCWLLVVSLFLFSFVCVLVVCWLVGVVYCVCCLFMILYRCVFVVCSWLFVD